MKHIELTHAQWDSIKERIQAEYGNTVLMLSSNMKKHLGFTVREHSKGFEEWSKHFKPHTDWRDSRSIICLDFYSESMKVWFQLKYM
jgi:hypothetical protein